MEIKFLSIQTRYRVSGSRLYRETRLDVNADVNRTISNDMSACEKPSIASGCVLVRDIEMATVARLSALHVAHQLVSRVASIPTVPARPLHWEFEVVLTPALRHKVEVLVGGVQRLPVPRSSEYPAFRRDHWAVGRPSVRIACLPLNRCGQPRHVRR